MKQCQLTNTEVLCFVLGWQGGTVHQVANTLNVSVDDILDADHDKMHDLCRKAQYTLNQDDDEDCDLPDEPNDSMDGDFDSGMASAGFGTDEDYNFGCGSFDE